jgi:hypothetical protein
LGDKATYEDSDFACALVFTHILAQILVDIHHCPLTRDKIPSRGEKYPRIRA